MNFSKLTDVDHTKQETEATDRHVRKSKSKEGANLTGKYKKNQANQKKKLVHCEQDRLLSTQALMSYLTINQFKKSRLG